VTIAGCNRRFETDNLSLFESNKQDPALSGDGRILAVIREKRGKTSIQLQNLANGIVLPIPQLNRDQPHSSPSLTWNGRYLALITQKRQRRLAIILDRISGRIHPLIIPGGLDPIRLSLAPDGRKIAIQVADKGRWKVELLDLSAVLEADLPSGLAFKTPQLKR
tara:strand:- start:289 stop:780 length:492 start_codon:yes stop_codon:yes gene_type:complete